MALLDTDFWIDAGCLLLLASVLTSIAKFKKLYRLQPPLAQNKIPFTALIFTSIALFLTRLNYRIIFYQDSSSFSDWLNFYIELLLVAFLMIYISKRNLQWIYQRQGKHIGLGLFTLLPALSWVALAGMATELLQSNHTSDQGRQLAVHFEHNPLLFYGIALLSIIIGPIYEEIVFRGIIQNYLSEYVKPAAAIVISSLIFALLHAQYDFRSQNLEIITRVFIFSLFIGYLYKAKGSLISCIVCHAASNLITIAAYITLSPSL